MMSVILMTLSNILFMPYLTIYRLILDRLGAPYDIIVWNRFQMKEDVRFVDTDRKYGHERNHLDYLRYCHYIKQV